MPEIRKSLADRGADILGGTASQYAAFTPEESARWAEVIRQAGVKAE
jgi:hypothetical protein